MESYIKNIHNQRISISGIIIFLIVLDISVFAQASEPGNVNMWINGGFGFSTVGSLAGNANFNLQINRFLFSVRTSAYAQKTGIFSGGDEFSDVAILFGIGTVDSDNFASVSVGIAKLSGSRYQAGGGGGFFSLGTRIPVKPVLGLAIESKLNIKLGNTFSIGFSPYIDINKEQSLFCLTICLGLGKLN